jgi:hypothetical protein
LVGPALIFAARSAPAAEPAKRPATNSDQPQLRDWTDKDGNRRVRAALVGVQGSKLLFRKANGKLATSTLEALSDTDRRYVASAKLPPAVSTLLPIKPPAEANGQRAENAEPRGLAGVVGSLAERIARPDSPSAAAPKSPLLEPDPKVIPATLVHVRVSREFLRDYIQRDIRQGRAVNDCILGTPVNGWAETNGVTDLVLRPSEGQAVADIVFSGSIQSRTVGHAGRALLHNVGNTRFQSIKRLAVGSNGLRQSPAAVAARTRSTTLDIEPLVPGLRGRIVERVAWRRVEAARGQADAIVARKAERQVAAEFDGRVTRSVGAIAAALRERVPQLSFDRDRLPSKVDFRSTADHVEVAMRRPGATREEWAITPPAVEGDPDIVVHAHRTIVRRAVGDPEIRATIQPLLSRLLKARKRNRALPVGAKSDDPPNFRFSWSADRNWLVVEYDSVRQPETLPEPVISRATGD